jgi:hypothetical protein
VTDNSEMTKPKSGISRRTVVKGTAWAVPAVVVASAAPAMAAGTSQCLTATFGGNSCKQPGTGQNDFGYRLEFCFTNTCSVAGTINVTRIASNVGNPVVKIFDPPLQISIAANSSACYPTLIDYCSQSSANFIAVQFTVTVGSNTGPVQVQLVRSPPQDCAPGTVITGCA